MGVIYKLEFSSGKSYIGQTVRALGARIQQHRQAVAAGSLLPVHCAWRLHGEPVISILGKAADGLHDMERAAIIEHRTLAPNGYNVSHGGDTAPSKAPEVAAKIAQKATGRRMSEEVKARLRESMRLRWQDPEYQAKVYSGVAAANGPEHAQKRSAKIKKAWETKRAAGWQVSESTKQKISAKVITDETRKKMSESAIKRGPPTKALEASLKANKGVKRGPYAKDRAEKAAAGVKAAWQDPEKRERLMAARKAAWVTRKAKLKPET